MKLKIENTTPEQLNHFTKKELQKTSSTKLTPKTTKHPQTKSFDVLMEKLIGKEKCAEIQEQTHREVEIVRSMHSLVTSCVDEYMKEQNIGFNELVKILDLSPTYVSKMRKGQANLTFGTFAHVMATLGKDVTYFLKQ